MDLHVGQPAPDFSLPDASGKPLTLSAFRGQKAVVVYFYPKDETPGCTAEACSFRDQYEDFRGAGAEVIGISTDTVASHKAFAEHHRLPFILLADADGVVHDAWGVGKILGLMRRRKTFLIDKEGVVRHIFESNLNMKAHRDEALVALKSMQAS